MISVIDETMHNPPLSQYEIFDYMPDGIVVLDQHGIIVSCNRAAPRLFGLPIGDWVGQPLSDVIVGSPLAGDLRALLLSGSTDVARSSIYSGNDGLIGIELRLHPLPGGRVRAGSLLVLHDITAQLRAEEALSQRIAELMLINQITRATNAAPDMEAVLRAITETPIRTLQWDRLAVALVQTDGVTLRMVIDQPFHNSSVGGGRTGVEDDHALMLNVLRSRRARVLYVHDVPEEMLSDVLVRRAAFQVTGTPAADSLERMGFEMMLAVPLHSAERTLGLLLVNSSHSRAVTTDELRLFETIGTLISDAVVRTALYEEAAQASQLKTVFLASVTHELRSPMTSIIGFADMLARGVFGTLPESAHEPVELVRHSSKRLLRIINDILDYSKMEAGRLKIDLYAVELDSVIRTVASTMRPQLQDRNLSLELDLPATIPRIYANSARLEQVLINLVANAIKFTESGSITVQIAVMDDMLRIGVQDTGIGIAPEDQSAIFEPFKQVEHQNQRYGGTGLGLAISKRLIEMMDGTLTLESVIGVGSTFICTLPLVTPPLNGSAQASVPEHTPAQIPQDMPALVGDHQ